MMFKYHDNFFSASSSSSVQLPVQQINISLLEHCLEPHPDLSESEFQSLKLKNNHKGVSGLKQSLLNDVAKQIHTDNLNLHHEEERLKYIDILSLHANHLIDHTDTSEIECIPVEVEKEKVLSWITAAYKLAQSITPELDVMIAEQQINKFLLLPVETLSTLCMMLHYHAKIEWLYKDTKSELILSKQTIAVEIAKKLSTLEKPDHHYSTKREIKYELVLIDMLCKEGRYDRIKYNQAEEILLDRLRKLMLSNDVELINYSTIMLTQQSRISRKLHKHYDDKEALHSAHFLAELARKNARRGTLFYHAEVALMKATFEEMKKEYEAGNPFEAALLAHSILFEFKLVTESRHTLLAETMINPSHYFDKKTANMLKEQTDGNVDSAQEIAQHILSKFENNPHCGVTQQHLEQANSILHANSDYNFSV